MHLVPKSNLIKHKEPLLLSKEEFASFEIKDILLGSGSYGNVYLSLNVKEQREYAIKKLNKAIIKEKLGNFQSILKEIDIHSQLIHPNIIRLYSYYEDNEYFYLIMDNTQEGNLYQLLKRKKQFNEKEAFSYFIQAAKAVHFLHGHNYIHRDIKPENLLINNDIEIKLCDFGLCNNNSIGNRSTFCGTLEYMAPEIISENSYDKAVDIWSLGILLYELTNGKTPFKINLQNLRNQTHLLSFINNKISNQCKDLIQKMLCINPRKRITIRGLFQEEIMTEAIQSTRESHIKNSTFKNINKSAIKPTIPALLLSNKDSFSTEVIGKKEDSDGIIYKANKIMKNSGRSSINNEIIDHKHFNSNLTKINNFTNELKENEQMNRNYTYRLSQFKREKTTYVNDINRKKTDSNIQYHNENDKKNEIDKTDNHDNHEKNNETDKKNNKNDNNNEIDNNNENKNKKKKKNTKLTKKKTNENSNNLTSKPESFDAIANTLNTENFTNNTLLAAIKLVERAKEVKKEIEIENPIER